jgi:tRNA threonylcarbamoyl adenosine modification protein YeaZ
VNTVLAIDTASDAFALALREGGHLGSEAAPAGREHSRLILSAVGRLLAGRRPDGIVVTRGPGGYSALRAGLATAGGLAAAWGVPIAGVMTLEAVAAASGLAEVVAIHHAGRGTFAWQRFAAGRAVSEIAIDSPADLPAGPLAGEGARALGGVEVDPRARCEAALALGLAALDGAAAGTPEAIYLRPPSITLARRRPVRAG